MSIPDFDYELEKSLGQHEYSVGLAEASTPKDMNFVAEAFRAGQLKERQRITDELESLAQNGVLTIALFKLRKIIGDDRNY